MVNHKLIKNKKDGFNFRWGKDAVDTGGHNYFYKIFIIL